MTQPIFDACAWLYHATQPAKLFWNEAEYVAALANGWADSPAKAVAVDHQVPDEGLPWEPTAIAAEPLPGDVDVSLVQNFVVEAPKAKAKKKIAHTG